MKRLITGVLITLCATAAVAQTPLTFEDALRRALVLNNQVEQSRQEIRVAESNRRFLLSAVMPKINATGNLQRNSIERSFGSGADKSVILPRNNWDYRIVMSQPVFAGRRELRAYSQAKLNVANAREGTRETEDATLLRVASSFLALLNAEARIEVEKKNIDLAERRRTQAEAFFKAGEVTKVDILRAETAVKSAQRLLAAAQQAHETAESDLREALDLEGAINPVPPAQKLPSVPDEATLISHAEASRPDLNIAQNNVRIANLEVSKQRGYWLPTVTFDGGIISQKSSFPASNYTYGAFRFNVPVFQSGEVFARIAGAKAKEEEAKLGVESAKLAVREDIRRALAALHAADTSLGLAREQFTAAEAEYAQSFELYRAQEATSLDVSASETSLADARRAVAEESLNRDLAELRVWYAAGDIKQAVGVTSR